MSHHLPRLPSNRSDLQVTPVSFTQPSPILPLSSCHQVLKLEECSKADLCHHPCETQPRGQVHELWSGTGLVMPWCCLLRAQGLWAMLAPSLPYSSASGQSSLHLAELLQNEGVGGRGAAPWVTPSRCPTNDGCWHHPRVFYPADAPVCSGLESRSRLSSFPLQSASNTATRLIIKTHKSVHVTPWFRKYLWASYFQWEDSPHRPFDTLATSHMGLFATSSVVHSNWEHCYGKTHTRFEDFVQKRM